MKRLILSVAVLGLTLAGLAPQAQATVLVPNTGSGITVDGSMADWNLAADFASDMYNAGRPTPGWPGYAVLSRLYLRYDCERELLFALVLDVEGDGRMVSQSGNDAWLKLYGAGLPGDKLVDGSGGGTTSHAFSWVVSDELGGILVGYEACAHVTPGEYAQFEAHVNIQGATSSTGKKVQGYAVGLSLDCSRQEVEASEQPVGVELAPACPNPFNPATTLTVTLGETGAASLKVYDMAGRQVALLFDGMAEAGVRSVRFDASALPSGLYVAVLESARGVSSQKLLLVK